MDNKLRARIIEHFGHQYHFARALKTHEVEVTSVVHGRKVLTPEKRRLWARLLKCKVSDLVPPEA